MLRLAIDTISNSANKFSANDFFSTKKSEIIVVMKSQLDKRLRQDVNIEIVFFQLLSIDLDDRYEKAIQDTEVSRQDIEKAEAERNKNNVT